MTLSVYKVLWIGVYTVSSFFAFTNCVQKWNMHERCGQHLEGFGGEIYFDAGKLPAATRSCRITIVGNGTEDYMLSLYFTSYNVSAGCLANITLSEAKEKGLHQSFCTENPYLNEYLIYTTNGRFLSLIFTKRVFDKPVEMAFSIKYVTFVSRVKGCTEEEITKKNMYSCHTGRCVHKSVVCEDLNPCGDQMDCMDTEGRGSDKEDQGFSFIKFVIITVVMVFGIFAIIQVCLIVRNEHGVCTTSEQTATIDAEFIPMPNGDTRKVRVRDSDSDSGVKDAASESLITREPV